MLQRSFRRPVSTPTRCPISPYPEICPQLVSRRHFVPIEHPRMAVTTYEENGFRLSKSGGGITQPGPMIGQHTERVLIEFLGLSADEVRDLSEGGALD